MKKKCFLRLPLIFLIILTYCATGSAQLHESWDQMLDTYVSDNGQVDYSGWKKAESELDDYLDRLSGSLPGDDASSEEAMAYWINAYNAFTVKLILENYPVKSIMDLSNGKVWDKKWINLGEDTYSLNQIEHEILRTKYKDPRIHFAVNCAASSCPPLWNRAFTPQRLNEQLEQRTRSFIRSEKYNSISADKLEVSKIFEWYEQDFGDLRSFINRYVSFQIHENADIHFRTYNWKLNE